MTIFEASEQIVPVSTVTVNGILEILALTGTTTQTIGALVGSGTIMNDPDSLDAAVLNV